MKLYSHRGPSPRRAAAFTVAVFTAAVSFSGCSAAELVPVPLNLPAPTLKGTPADLPTGPNIEPPTDKAPALPQIPKEATNVAFGKKVTGSTAPFNGDLAMITDGKKEAFDDQAVEFKKGIQWVQVDLGADFLIHAIAVWHDHRYVQIFHAVVVQVSDDPEFKTGVTTLFNNDTDNSAGLGAGTDREYFEKEWGKVIPAKGVKARYVRGYTRGGNTSALNCWQEMEVYAVPAK
jgi:hypothetical protein